MTTLIAISIAAYFLGGIPTAYLLGKWRHGVDVRTIGSGNVGAANAADAFGYGAGALVLTADAAKGAVTAGLAIAFGVAPWGAAVVAVMVVAGHNFSPYLRLGGGRGVATALGVSAVVVPIIAIVGLLVGALWFLRTRRIVGSGVSAFAVTNVLVVLVGAPGAVLAMCAAMSLLVLATHLGRAYLGRAHLAALEVSAGRRR